MNAPTDLMSWSTPQKSAPLASPSGFENPVPTGSIITRSVTSSTLNSLSTRGVGGGGA